MRALAALGGIFTVIVLLAPDDPPPPHAPSCMATHSCVLIGERH